MGPPGLLVRYKFETSYEEDSSPLCQDCFELSRPLDFFELSRAPAAPGILLRMLGVAIDPGAVLLIVMYGTIGLQNSLTSITKKNECRKSKTFASVASWFPT